MADGKQSGNNQLTLNMVKGIGAGVVSAILVMLILSLLMAIIVYFSPIAEDSLHGVAVIINAIAIFIGGYITAHLAGSRGLLLGLTTAALILMLMILFGPGEGGNITLKVVYCLLAGMIGGIFGVR